MHLVFLYGPPAVGKLTVARELAALTGFRLFHNHLTVDLVSSVFEFGSELFVELRERIWLEVIGAAAVAGTSLIFTFAPEATVRQHFVGNVVETVRRAGGRVWFVELTCPPEQLLHRMGSPERARFGKLRSGALFRQLQNEGTFDVSWLPRPDLTVDTAERLPADAARLISEWLMLNEQG